MDNKLIDYCDFQGIMREIAIMRGWEFKFGDESVPVDSVFNAAMFAPALLAAGSAELHVRRIPFDLGIEIEEDKQSLFGARVVFDESRNSTVAQIWRLALSTMIIESLPKSGQCVSLDPLQYVLGDRFGVHLTEESAVVEEAS